MMHASAYADELRVIAETDVTGETLAIEISLDGVN